MFIWVSELIGFRPARYPVRGEIPEIINLWLGKVWSEKLKVNAVKRGIAVVQVEN